MAETEFDKCPRCSSRVTNRTECESCGIIFEKYLQAEARNRAEAERIVTVQAGSGSHRIGILAGLVLVAAIAAAAYLAGRLHSSPEKAEAPPPDISRSGTGVMESPPQGWPPAGTGKSPGKPSHEESIQMALRATVSVRTSWGSMGSGFFMGEHEVVTNRHVVVFDEARFDDLKARVERNRKMIDLESAKINEWKRRVTQMPGGPARSQLELLIQSRETELDKYMSAQRSDEERLAKIKDERNAQDIRIVTGDNKEYPVDNIYTSASHDLALLIVRSVTSQYLRQPTGGDRLEQGQAVYAIGSPMGLTNTVTSGIFSAYRKKTNSEETYLQINASINPGNSGGPLIDDRGNVIGVNTMVLANAEGIGFAIPIEAVLADFSHLLH